jgi:CRP-like cAMP-binding protein
MVSTVKLPKGDVLFRQGDEGEALYLIDSGTIEVFKKDTKDHEQVIAVLEGGGVVGEMSLLIKEKRSASGRATSDTTLIELPARDFKQLLDTSSLVAYKMTLVMAKVLARRIRQLNEKLVEIQRDEKHSDPKLAEFAEFKKKIMSEFSF